MKVILREEVESLGNAGDVVTVKDGYARNYLLPRKLAVRADEHSVKQHQHIRRSMLARRGRLEATARKKAKTVEEVGRVVVTRACGVEGKLFGSVTTRDIAAGFAERGIELDRRAVQLSDPLKQLGDFDVTVKLGQGVLATVKVSVEPDEASAEMIAQAAASQGAPPDDETA